MIKGLKHDIRSSICPIARGVARREGTLNLDVFLGNNPGITRPHAKLCFTGTSPRTFFNGFGRLAHLNERITRRGNTENVTIMTVRGQHCISISSVPVT